MKDSAYWKERLKDNTYWKERFESLENQQYEETAAYYRDLQRQFQKAQVEIQEKIEHWMYRIADNNEISRIEARKFLNESELAEFKWSLEDYIKHGKENSINQQWMKELENASARVHIQKLEAMQLQMRAQAEILFANYGKGVASFLGKSYESNFYKTAHEVAKGTGIGRNIPVLDRNKIDTVIRKPWAQDGANFSDRVWGNKQKLVNELHTELVQNVIRGENPQKAAKRIAEKMEVSGKQAKRLVFTESAAIATKAREDCFNSLGVEKYEIVATLDSKTSDICQSMDGEIFDMRDYEVGVTAPPFHPNCRSCTCPYFDDEFTEGETRAARDSAGQTFHVPADMKYGEWKKQYVKDAASLTDIKAYGKYQKILCDNAPATIEDFMKIRYNDDAWNKFKAYANSIKSGEITALADFGVYQRISSRIDHDLIGKITSNGIAIHGKSNHFIARTIGSIEQRRSGVSSKDALGALVNPTRIEDIRENKNGRSQRFISDKVAVTINPDTGTLIQVNPRIRRKGKS